MASVSLPTPGSSPRPLDAVARLVVDDLGASPAAVVAASALVGGYWRRALGVHGVLFPGGPEATSDTVFDLASVTKPLVALAAARLGRRHPGLLATPLGRVLAEVRGGPSEFVPLELFLAHRAGLEGHRPLYAPMLTGDRVDRAASLAEAARARRPECTGEPPREGFSPLYSDLGYLLVGAALERVAHQRLDDLIASEVTVPSGGGIVSAATLHERGLVARTAPTEVVDWRGGAVRGEVHDENAWALGGRGVCGHAGLFGDAGSLARVGEWVVEALAGQRPDWLAPAELEPLIRPRHGGTLRAGFDGKSPSGSSAGSELGERSFGHLGFTGTSLWIDPDRPLIVALLTNRVHPTRAADAIRRARPAAHDAVAAWAAGL